MYLSQAIDRLVIQVIAAGPQYDDIATAAAIDHPFKGARNISAATDKRHAAAGRRNDIRRITRETQTSYPPRDHPLGHHAAAQGQGGKKRKECFHLIYVVFSIV